MRAGLIPSRALQERRIVHERNEQMKANPEDSDLGKFIIGRICQMFALKHNNLHKGLFTSISYLRNTCALTTEAYAGSTF